MSREPAGRRYGRFFGPDPKRDAEDEIQFHLALRIEEFERAGMTAQQAREAAVQRFGDVDHVRDECRELDSRRRARRARALRLDAFLQNVRFARRTLWTNRGFSFIVALTMAIGIGANTAVFSVAYGVLLRPLPYRDAGALVRLWSRNSQRGVEFFSVSPADYMDWRAQNRVFTAMGAFERQHDGTVSRGAGQPELITVTAVTPDIFSLLGTPAFRGRTILPDDARDGAPPVAVMSYDLWTSRFGSDSALIGGEMIVDSRRMTIVGVMPPRFAVPGTSAQIWTALSLAGAPQSHGNRYLRVLARVAPGVTVESAREQMDVIARRIGRSFPQTNGAWSVNIMSVPEMLIGSQFRRSVIVLLGVVAFVLFIACANAANLQLARSATRRREIAVRTALGASRGQITGLLLVESALLALVAGAIGTVLAYGGLVLLRAVGGTNVPRLEEVRIDGPVLAFTAIIALGSGVLFGLLPAIHASSADINGVLKEGGRAQARGVLGEGMRSALVVVEISLSLVLLVGAGLLMRSFAKLGAVDIGFDPRKVVVIPLALPEASYAQPERVAATQAALLERVRRLPGVRAAAAVTSAPFAGANSATVFLPDGRTVTNDQPPDADYRSITPGYLEALGIRLLRGRDFSSADRAEMPKSMLISEAMARRYWPDEDPLGKRVRIGDIENGPVATIVGVVSDARYQSLEAPELRPMMYFSELAAPKNDMSIVVRGADAATLAPVIRQIVASIDASLPPPPVMNMADLIAQATTTRQFALMLFGVFAGAALALAGIGVYGVMSYLVRQRTHELGIRIALGASPRSLVASVVGRTLRITVVGVMLGIAGAWGLTRFLSALLFDIEPTDAATFSGVALLLTFVALLASLVPARRATRADPLVALRGD